MPTEPLFKAVLLDKRDERNLLEDALERLALEGAPTGALVVSPEVNSSRGDRSKVDAIELELATT